jgi:peptide/nickel transport system ATP-binding protein
MSEPVSESLLAVNDLSVMLSREGRPSRVLDRVSFDMFPGEVVALVGESGSGKTSIGLTLQGLLPREYRPQVSGSIRLAGVELVGAGRRTWRSARRHLVRAIAQDPMGALNPTMTIRGQMRESNGKAGRSIEEWLSRTGLTDPDRIADALPHHLSGGQRQRVLVAMAMMARPKLLIADEPTTALDVTVQARILTLLKDLNRERGLAIILISHDLGVVADICSRVVVMRNGEVVEQGPIRDVIERPRHPYTQLLINSQPGRKTMPTLKVESEAATPLLSIESLSVSFPVRHGPKAGLSGGASSFLALDGVDIRIDAGETVGIVGESGSGKSTLARAIVRQNRPSGGFLRFGGEDVDTLSGEALTRFRRRVQMVFQNPYDSLNPRMTIADTVAEPIWRHGLADRRSAAKQADELLEMMELPAALRNRKPRQLSGGQCQRVGLARALALKPQLLIADEITSALDVTTQAQILELLIRLQRERSLALLYISHDLSVVGSICKRVYVFKGGRVVETGAASQVLSAPQHPYTQELVGSLSHLSPVGKAGSNRATSSNAS